MATTITPISALLQVITPQTIQNTQNAATTLTLTPTPTNLTNDVSVLVISGIEVDTVKLQVRYEYLAYQTYYTANSTVVYIAIVQGQTGYISIPNLCPSYSNVTIIQTPTPAPAKAPASAPTAATKVTITQPIPVTTNLTGSIIQFTINVNIEYDSCIVGLYQVDTEL